MLATPAVKTAVKNTWRNKRPVESPNSPILKFKLSQLIQDHANAARTPQRVFSVILAPYGRAVLSSAFSNLAAILAQYPNSAVASSAASGPLRCYPFRKSFAPNELWS
jgi:hypothetical protein